MDEGEAADLVIGNNVLAHVPPVHDFVEGLRVVLKPGGVVTMEFPHLLKLIEEREFDTIYHEHYSYWSLLVVERLFGEHGLALFDVEELPTHGGSLRIFARHAEEGGAGEAVEALKERERAAGLDRIETYEAFGESVRAVKRDLLEFLVGVKRDGQVRRRLRRRSEGNDAPQLLRDPLGLRRLRGRPQPAQAGDVAAGRAASRSMRRSTWPRRGPTTS